MGNLLQKSWAATPEIQAQIQALARLELHRRRDEIKKDSLKPTNVLRQRILDGLLEYQQPICEDFDHRIIGFCAGYEHVKR